MPISYWLIAGAFGVTFIVAIGGYFAAGWFAAVGGVGVAVIVGALAAFGGVRVRVDDQGLRVGRSVLDWRYVAAVRALDADQLRRRLGPEADARAFLVVRPYLRHGVEVTVDDAADPHPYWVVGSRHASELARAIATHLSITPNGNE